jgi:hypothetical protein
MNAFIVADVGGLAGGRNGVRLQRQRCSSNFIRSWTNPGRSTTSSINIS